METTVAVVAEHRLGLVNPVTYEAIACALEILRIRPSRLVTITIGEDSEEAGRQIAAKTGSQVLALKVPGLEEFNGDAYRTILAGLLAELEPAWVCIPGTSQGLDFSPGLAVRLGQCCISNVERVVERDGEPAFARSLFNGKIVAELSSLIAKTLLMVQPGAFSAVFTGSHSPGVVETRTIEWKSTHIRSLGFRIAQSADSALAEASVIVSAGRGVGSKENLDLVRRVASLFSKSTIAGSRPLCDLGWLPYQLQVGQTGATVTPDLYLACGISGAQQHLAGMGGSKFIVAVNTDPNAAIFNVADVGVVDDLEGFLSDLLEESNACSHK
ncbi:MAG: electron transfer flavoprotein subunit alpha/FixB family protein [Desulfomonile tiedjei]|uniref:Electron transfer flavoprotein subunit alpha/FixB family protein n=1 Tax=Desulfomonile tiedjei TaxID=2358 RepID=A0A9D6Z4M3_9BACT|nr:electron transfer flavoprotein subunit alpha/FixB family protein [Desulfomonile tiedjei]